MNNNYTNKEHIYSNKKTVLEAKNKKKSKKHRSNITYTTGDPYYNIKQFNKRMGTDFTNPSTEEAKAQKAAEAAAKVVGIFASASPDGGSSATLGSGSDVASSGEGMVENLQLKNKTELQEAKRYVRRYYIRPQNVFCSNKTDIINALIEFENQNCTIYTLNNLGDIKDVTKLTNNDIIYYYDDYVLYDKNHVRIMDYDLYIKHEENRKKIDPDKVSDAVFNKVYQDRLTGYDGMDEAFNLNFIDIDAYGRKLVEGKEIDGNCCICGEEIEGYGNNAEPYKEGRCCDACNLKFVIPARIEQMQEKESD